MTLLVLTTTSGIGRGHDCSYDHRAPQTMPARGAGFASSCTSVRSQRYMDKLRPFLLHAPALRSRLLRYRQ